MMPTHGYGLFRSLLIGSVTAKVLHDAKCPISDALALPPESALQEEVNQQARAKIESLQKSAGVEASLEIAVGSVAEAVAKAAEQQGVNLILIGRGSLQGSLGRLRTHAYGIIHKSPCPVLSV